jgi:hypothetical protein
MTPSVPAIHNANANATMNVRDEREGDWRAMRTGQEAVRP